MANELNLIEIKNVLASIKKKCEDTDGHCTKCPFIIDGHDVEYPSYCIFNLIPQDWEVEKLNVYKFVKEHMSSLYGNLSDINS